VAFTPANPVVPAASISDHYREQLFLNAASYETPIPTPTVPPAVVAAAGALVPGLYYCGYTWMNGNGETAISPTQAILLTVPSQLTITVPGLPGGVSGANYYITALPGAGNPTNMGLVGQNAGPTLVVNSLPSQAAPAPLATASGDTDDYKSNAILSNVPTKVGRDTDATAYPAQPTDDSWVVHVRERGKYV
jgi:hypothetical protein